MFWRRAPADPPPSPDQDRDLLLYKFDHCPYCRRVMASIEDLGLDVPTADTRRDAEAYEALRSATGRTQVPCLFIDGQALFESEDIVAWLERYAARQ